MKDPILNIVLPLSWSVEHNRLAAEILRDFLINGGLVREVPYMELIDLNLAATEDGFQELSLVAAGTDQLMATVRLSSLPEGELCKRLVVMYFYDSIKEEHFVLLDDSYTETEGFYYDWWLVRAYHSLGLNGAEFEQLMPRGALFDQGSAAMLQRYSQWFVANGFDFATNSRPEGVYFRVDNGEINISTFAADCILGGVASLGLQLEAEYTKADRFEGIAFGPFGHLRVQNQLEAASDAEVAE